MSETMPFQHDDELAIDLAAGLCEPEQRDALMARAAAEPEFARRVEKARGLFRLMDCCEGPEPSPQVIERALTSAASAARTRMLLDREAARAGAGLRSTFTLKEMGALAALLVIGAALLMPSLQQARNESRDRACQAQTGQIGLAMAKYANDHGGKLPAIQAGPASWLADGTGQPVVSNSRNLWTLIRGQYAHLHLFQCPAVGAVLPTDANVARATLSDFPDGQYIGYSYQHAVNSRPLRLSEGALRMVILADRTPVFFDGRFRPERLVLSVSPNHGGRGQAVLHLDLGTSWARSADVGVNRDNIWLMQGVSLYRGIETPTQAADSFLLPSFTETRAATKTP